MRPVHKGNTPTDVSGQPKTYRRYGDAKPDLLRRLGGYCSYCEMELKDGQEVEHVQPKSKRRDLETSWSNFLLACKRCNTRKSDEDVELDDYLWPDRDNTLIAFEYSPYNSVSIAPGLDAASTQRAQNLLELVGLDNLPKEKFEDPRYDHRLAAWRKATYYRQRLWDAEEQGKAEVRNSICILAIEAGHFSVWMAVFANDPITRRMLIEAFTGTASDCFHPNTTTPVRRPSGKL